MAENEKPAGKRIVWNRNGLLTGKQVVGIKMQIEGNIEDMAEEKRAVFTKVIYFDESAAQDYLDITNGGRFD